ncbi:heparinase II/III family protein [Sphingosinicella sp. BN140058]|uniref:heparinase II/III family protein n=1 Tax=Sphingosinicella sp. BN140058 TaxID=1892855 RepID=UPI001010788C|nr:heparinase II/III family protein [Sphingosinicella sp. BN140058]QAY76921.1 heparinase [Sphingosinicella sp. BN140058]
MIGRGDPGPTGREDGIGDGKRLIRAGHDRGVSLAERLSWRFHRLSWRTPFQSFRLRGRYPLKLLAVPKDPVAGDKAAGEAILQGHFAHRGGIIAVDDADFADARISPDFADYLQSFEWLRDLAAAATRERAAKIAEKALQKWLIAYASGTGERAWRADLTGRRILFWAAYAPYILSSRDAEYRATVLKTLVRSAQHLDRVADKAPAGLARITAWAGIIAVALVVQGSSSGLSKGEAGLLRALTSGLHDDGGLVSRSPVEQLALVELLSQLRAVYYAGDHDMPELLADALEGAVAALLGVTLGDEALSSWQGGNQLSRRRLAAAVEGTGVRARPLSQPRGWGYQRLEAKQTITIFDAAPPPPTRSLSGACASTLAFELCEGPNRLVVNCGGVGTADGALPAELLAALRTTAAHSTLTLGDRNSTAIHEDGTLGKGVTQVELSRDESNGVTAVEASHDGYVRRFGLIHQRTLILSPDGKELSGEDILRQEGRKRRGDIIPFAVRFHLAPAVEAATTADGQGALLRIRNATVWQFRCRGGKLAIEDSIWIDGEAKAHASLQLVISGEMPPEGTSIAWTFKRA